MKEHIYMTSGESVNAKLKISCEDKINDIISWFGSDITIHRVEDNIFVKLKVNEEALVYWAMQYGECVEVVFPNQTREKIKNLLIKMLNKYSA